MTKGRLPSIAERILLRGFGRKEEMPRASLDTYAYCDGESVVTSIYSSKAQVRNKRRRVDISSLRETADDELVGYEHIATTLMIADGLTKRDEKLRLVIRSAMAGTAHLP